MSRSRTSTAKLLLYLLLSVSVIVAQYNSQTYPDPRTDPLSCRLGLLGPVCDPASILSDEERGRLAARIQQLVAVTAPIRNTSPSCAQRPAANLELTVAVIDKIGSQQHAPVDIEKFANNLKRRYQNFQDVGICDTSVLIVNSRQDRQVFTVAGRDARISKETLRKAFERNIGHFKEGRYALGLEGMVEVIVAAYTSAHIARVPSPDTIENEPFVSFPEAGIASNIATRSIPPAPQPFQQPEPIRHFEELSPPTVPTGFLTAPQSPISPIPIEIEDKDRVWIDVMKLAIARCGNGERMPENVRAVVEEAMAISLQLISDPRYNSIEEEVDSHKDVLGIRDQAWRSAANEFLVPLYNKYAGVINAGSSRTCPAITTKNRLLHLLSL